MALSTLLLVKGDEQNIARWFPWLKNCEEDDLTAILEDLFHSQRHVLLLYMHFLRPVAGLLVSGITEVREASWPPYISNLPTEVVDDQELKGSDALPLRQGGGRCPSKGKREAGERVGGRNSATRSAARVEQPRPAAGGLEFGILLHVMLSLKES